MVTKTVVVGTTVCGPRGRGAMSKGLASPRNQAYSRRDFPRSVEPSSSHDPEQLLVLSPFIHLEMLIWLWLGELVRFRCRAYSVAQASGQAYKNATYMPPLCEYTRTDEPVFSKKFPEESPQAVLFIFPPLFSLSNSWILWKALNHGLFCGVRG
jgi:hypothetical protein